MDIRRLPPRLEGAAALDAVANPLAAAVHRAVPAGSTVKRLLAGEWLGHELHPLLTDLPIGFWTSAWVLDIVGGRRSRPAAQRLVALGVLSAVPTIVTGASDWADAGRGARRVGVAHAAANAAATACYVASWRARRRGRHLAGVGWGMAGAAAATAGGYLGGDLVFRLGVGPHDAG